MTIHTFGQFEFDERRWELRADGSACPVPPKVMQLLSVLLRNRDRLVSTEEFVAALWPGVRVTSGSLTKAVRTARKILGDDGGCQRWIKTVRGLGYRFVGPVREPASTNGQAEAARRQEPETPSGAGEPFVGREAELHQLSSSFDQSIAGRTSFVLVSGDPGIGKTRLTEVFAAIAEGRGALVARGRCCEEGGAPELRPWIQILQRLRSDGFGRAVSLLGAAISVLLEGPAPNETLGAHGGLSSASGRFRLFDSIKDGLCEMAAEQPLVLILEDLHAADTTSLALARFLVREIRNSRLLVLGTYRPGEVDSRHIGSGVWSKLVSEARVLKLTGIGMGHLQRLLAEALEQPPTAELVSRVHEATEGNPLFVTEIVRLFDPSRDGSPTPRLDSGRLPERITEVIRSRLDALPIRTLEMLGVAAVIGMEFEPALLRQAFVSATDELAATLESALASRIIVGGAVSMNVYRFSHALFREVLYDGLGVSRRAALHEGIGKVLEAAAAVGEAPAAQIAHHYARAALGAGSEKVWRYSVVAGDQAFRSFAFEEAIGHFERALDALRFDDSRDADRCEALVALGRACRASGDYARARENIQRACDLATGRGDAIRMARASLEYARAKPESGLAQNQGVVDLLEQAARALERHPDQKDAEELLSLTLAHLAMCLSLVERQTESEELSRRALDLARGAKRPLTLAHVLHDRHWALWRPGTAEERLAITSEILGLERSIRDSEPVREARICRITDLLELGRPDALGRSLDEYERLALRARDPTALWNAQILGATKALLQGRFAQAEQHANEALRLGLRLHHENAGPFFGVQLWWLRIEQGRGEEVEDSSRAFVEAHPATAVRAALLRLYVESGAVEPSREIFEALVAPGLSALRRDWSLLPTLAHLAAACASLSDVARALPLHAALSPYRAHHVVLGPAIVYLGPVSFYLGLLAAVRSCFDEAFEHFDRAEAEALALGARPWVARTQHERARAFIQRGAPGDASRARKAKGLARSLTSELGMAELETRAQKVHPRRLKSPA